MGSIKENSAVLVDDLGDGIVALILKQEIINSQTAVFVTNIIESLQDTYKGIVISGENNVCVGIDREEIVAYKDASKWSDIDNIINIYQSLIKSIKFSNIPVITLVKGQCFDIGLEIALASSNVLVSEDAFVGFNTVKNGFPPMAGGITQSALNEYAKCFGVAGSNVVPFLKKAYQNIYNGKPATGVEAISFGYLPNSIAVISKEKATLDLAKEKVMYILSEGYSKKEPDVVGVKGFTAKGALDITAINAELGGFISKTTLNIAKNVSRVISGGDVPDKTEVSEEQFLKVEKECFIYTLKEA